MRGRHSVFISETGRTAHYYFTILGAYEKSQLVSNVKNRLAVGPATGKRQLPEAAEAACDGSRLSKIYKNPSCDQPLGTVYSRYLWGQNRLGTFEKARS